MSVITDALKAAQRERARRQSNAVPVDAAPLLVPLRSKPDSSARPRRMALLSGIGVGLVALSLGARALLQTPTKPGALPTVPPITSTILAEALADSQARDVPARPDRAVAAENTAPVVREPAPAPQVAVRSAPIAEAAAPRTSEAATAIPQGESRAAPRPGRLRIAVENARPPRTAQLFADAVSAHRAGDGEAARKLYDSVLALAPHDADALNNLGVLLSARTEFSRALELLRRATVAAPRNPGPWNNIGAVFHAQARHNDAIAAFRHALALDPGHSGAKVGLAQQYLAIAASEQARGLLEQVISADPELPEAHYTLGQVYELQGDRVKAVKAYEEFVRVAPPRLAGHVDLVKRRIEMLTRAR